MKSSDVGMINYFYSEKGDITRWCDWEEKKTEVEKEYPELLEALALVEKTEKQIGRILDYMEEEATYDE